MKRCLLIFLGVLLVAATTRAQIPGQTQGESESGQAVPEPIIAAMLGGGGKELVIEPFAEKLASLGLKPEDLRILESRRFVKDKWKVTIKDKEIELDKVARLQLRPLQAPPFTVALPDGRQALITPKADRIARYLVPGHYFKRKVREALAGLFVEDPSKVSVLGGLRVPGGQVPNFWGPDHVHIALGEPLDSFADVRIQGAKGPQAAELDRMRALRGLVERVVAAEESTPRAQFEATFGKIQEHKDYGWIYPFGKSRVQLWFSGTPQVVGTIFYSEGKPASATGVAAEARAIFQVDREFLIAFLARKYSAADQQQKEQLRTFLDATESVVNWTAQERKNLLEQSP